MNGKMYLPIRTLDNSNYVQSEAITEIVYAETHDKYRGYGVIKQRHDNTVEIEFDNYPHQRYHVFLNIEVYLKRNKIWYVAKRIERTAYDYLKQRNVKELIHFTHIENLEYIIGEGILPRKSITHSLKTSDEMRIDKKEVASCFSISYPNFKMLYSKNRTEPYIILHIDIEVLRHVDKEKVAFFCTNAAERQFQFSQFEEFCNEESLRKMFSETVFCKIRNRECELYRNKQNLTEQYTTNPQAEILIKERVPFKYIKRITTKDITMSDEVRKILNKNNVNNVQVIDDACYYWPKGEFMPMWNDYIQQTTNNTNMYNYFEEEVEEGWDEELPF